ncbi:MAG: RNA-binding protein [Desulfobacteraceae bacterium 4572_130]|nr:MAG: RNA-binding protein [Desulfobacteraceae bacterium 4572_130]
MCEATAFLLKEKLEEKEESLIMNSVDKIEPEQGGIRLVNIFGEQKFIKGYIHSLSLVDHKIFLKLT